MSYKIYMTFLVCCESIYKQDGIQMVLFDEDNGIKNDDGRLMGMTLKTIKGEGIGVTGTEQKGEKMTPPPEKKMFYAKWLFMKRTMILDGHYFRAVNINIWSMRGLFLKKKNRVLSCIDMRGPTQIPSISGLEPKCECVA